MKDEEEEEKREKQLEEDERAKKNRHGRDQFRIDNGNGPNQSLLMNITLAYNPGDYLASFMLYMTINK